MSVLVTGGAGYIGSHMVWELLDRGAEVIVLDSLRSGFRWAVPDRAKLIVGDCGDEETVAEAVQRYDIDAVIHFAGSTSVPESQRDPFGYYRNNTANARSLFEAAARMGVRHFIFSSTAAVYGNPARMPVTEQTPTIPLSPYGRSKLMTETILHDAAEAHGLGYLILRYFNVAGADPAGRTGQSTEGAVNVMKVAIETALGVRPRFEVFGTDYPSPDGSAVRDFIHVTDLVRAHSAGLDHLRRGGASAILNAGYGHGTTVLEVIETVKEVSGTDFEVVLSPRRDGDIAVSVADARRLREFLGWKPQHDDLRQMVAHALAWERRLRGFDDDPRLRQSG